MWNHHKDFLSYHLLTKAEQECDQVLGVSVSTTQPVDIGPGWIKVEDDLNHIHTWHLHDT